MSYTVRIVAVQGLTCAFVQSYKLWIHELQQGYKVKVTDVFRRNYRDFFLYFLILRLFQRIKCLQRVSRCIEIICRPRQHECRHLNNCRQV